MEATNLTNIAGNTEQFERNILRYSFQKDAYQSHKIESDFLVDLILEKARVIQYLMNGIVLTEEPKNENAYIGIAVHHAFDYHFVEGLAISVSIIDPNGYEIGKKRHFYHPRPGLHHYGSNWHIPGDGYYTIRVQIETPDTKVRVNQEANFLPQKFEIDFPAVMIHTGHKLA